MQGRPPKCLTCAHFKGRPTSPKGRAKCAKKPNGITEAIYWDGGNCSSYTPKNSKKAK